MIDCLIIGMNEQPFDRFAKSQAAFKNYSGSYEEVFTNSVVVEGVHYTSTDLLNQLLSHVDTSNWNLSTFETPNLGVYYLCSYLRKRCLNVQIINHFNTGKEKIHSLFQSGVRCVAITTTFYVSDDPIIDIIDFIKSIDKSIPIIVGGPRIFDICSTYTTNKRNFFLNNIGADYYIVESQGEEALYLLVRGLKNQESLQDISNLIIRENDELYVTPRVLENNSLDENAVDWDMFTSEECGRVVHLRTACGCQFSCAYCTYPKFAGKPRYSSIETVEHEMDQLYAKGVKYLIFIDDSFNVPLRRFKAICELMIRKGYNFKWLSFFRCIRIDDTIAKLMKQSGCLGVYFGVESLDKSILKNMNKTGIDYISCLNLLAKNNVLTFGSFIVGFPGETENTIRETVRVFNENPSTFYNPQLYYHNMLAPINARASEFGLKGHSYSWTHSTMNWEEAVFWKNYMICNVNNSILLPLYSSGIWALPYFLESGLTIEFFIEYSKFISDLIKDGINKKFYTFSDLIEKFKTISSLNAVLRGG